MINRSKVITYSLLAHINNSGTLFKDLLDVFIPIVKKVLSDLSAKGVTKGSHISEIQEDIKAQFGIDIPVVVLERCLQRICREYNSEDSTLIVVHQDKSFELYEFVFDEFQTTIEKKADEIHSLEKLFKTFCETEGLKHSDYNSIFTFINLNNTSLSKYLSNTKNDLKQNDFQLEAQFIRFFQGIPSIFNLIKEIYIGSIISSYIEYKTENITCEVELLFDTNFIISLLDLNTPQSTKTTQRVIDIAKSCGYKLTVLNVTIEEAQNLLMAKAENFEKAYLQMKINPEDIYNACDRRNLSRTDLERIADNLELELDSKGISKVAVKKTIENKAKYSNEFEDLKSKRYNEFAALHDAIAIHYIREKRGKRIKNFEDVNAWFVNNSLSHNSLKQSDFRYKSFQPIIIKADDLLNVLWLSNPGMYSIIKTEELTEIGLNELISSTLNSSLPKSRVIKELDDNINKYKDDSISEQDILRVAARITERQIKDIDKLNALAESDPNSFVEKIKKESALQEQLEKERNERFDNAIKELRQDAIQAEKLSVELAAEKRKSEEERKNTDELKTRLKTENKNRAALRDIHFRKQLRKWRRKPWIELILEILIAIVFLLAILFHENWNISEFYSRMETLLKNWIFITALTVYTLYITGITIRTLFLRYRSTSEIETFKKGIVYPKEIQELE